MNLSRNWAWYLITYSCSFVVGYTLGLPGVAVVVFVCGMILIIKND